MSVELNSQPTTHRRKNCNCKRVRHEHGTEQAYISDRCRCRPCLDAHAQRAAWRRRQYAYGRDIAHLVPAAGSRRRLEALATLGWSSPALAGRLAVDPVTLHRVRLQPRITAAKAAAITALYDQLWDQPAPAGCKGERISVARTRRMAARRGYLPPLAWDDDELDDPAAKPHTPADRGWVLKPCGTLAAARRHYRNGEPLCRACRAAEAREEDEAA